MSCENFLIFFSEDENELRKQIRSNPSKGEATKKEKVEISFNFFSRKWFDVSDCFWNLSPFSIIRFSF